MRVVCTMYKVLPLYNWMLYFLSFILWNSGKYILIDLGWHPSVLFSGVPFFTAPMPLHPIHPLPLHSSSFLIWHLCLLFISCLCHLHHPATKQTSLTWVAYNLMVWTLNSPTLSNIFPSFSPSLSYFLHPSLLCYFHPSGFTICNSSNLSHAFCSYLWPLFQPSTY